MEQILAFLACLKKFTPDVISVASFSFQIAGAIFLLLWSFKPFEKTIVNNHFGQTTPSNFGRLGEGKVWIKITKEELQASAKTVWLNRLAFIDIILGYVFAIFIKETSVAAWCIFLFVVLVTCFILFIENISIQKYVRQKYKEDMELGVDNSDIARGSVIFQVIDEDQD